MKKLYRLALAVLLVLLLVGNMNFAASALEFGGIAVTGELPIPDDFFFTVNDDCSTHPQFNQAAASANGCFAVHSFHIDTETVTDKTFHKNYIDLYNADGSFCKEISFETQYAFNMELTEKTLCLYFDSCVIVYDLEDEQLYNYSIPEYAAEESGLNQKLRASRFTSGEWEYRCERYFTDYRRLVRSNEEQTQVLVEMPGLGMRHDVGLLTGAFYALLLVALLAVTPVALIIIAVICIRERKKQ